MTETQEKLVDDFTKDYYHWSLSESDNHYIERYIDYRDEYPESTIEKILNSSNPAEVESEEVFEWDCQADDWCYEKEFFSKLSTFCEENEIDEDDARNYVYDNFYWTYPESFLNSDCKVTIEIDAGDGNYDFACHNVCNYAKGNYHENSKGSLVKEAGMHWLAKQQGFLGELQKAIEGHSPVYHFNCRELINELYNYAKKINGYHWKNDLRNNILKHTKLFEWFLERDGEDDKLRKVILDFIKSDYDLKNNIKTFVYERSDFVDSAIVELEEQCSNLASLNFLVSMPLQDAITLKEAVKEAQKKFNVYHPLTVKGNPFGYITLDKCSTVGLNDQWNGCSSQWDIKLAKDVKLPLQFINNVYFNKSLANDLVDDVFGRTVKEIKLK